MSDDQYSNQRDGLLDVQEAKPALKKPPLYKVIIFNDDYTPMNFVVFIIQQFFGMDMEKATRIMFQVHTQGHGVCGVFTREIAETKVAQVNEYSRKNNHPLLCTMDKA